MNRFVWAAARAMLLSSAAIALVGLVAVTIRILPWLLDPAVPWRVAIPFARGLVAVALEMGLLIGWPVGWALACFRLVESGEARVLQALGERPWSTVGRLTPQGAAAALTLSMVALVYGSDASAPGRVATELIAQGRVSCERAPSPTTYAIPFTEWTWLCAPGRPPRLVGSPPFLPAASLSARDVRVSGDFARIDMDDARVAIPGSAPLSVHAGALSIRGLTPWWAHASTIPAWLRALFLAGAAWAAAAWSARDILRGVATGRTGVLVLAVAGPLAALGVLRVLERWGASRGAFALVPLASGACGAAAGAVLSRLRHGPRAASTDGRVA